jgi:hypothetical protein
MRDVPVPHAANMAGGNIKFRCEREQLHLLAIISSALTIAE